ncbi:TPA: ISNCY family transposase, partial [Raoultella ornithinolytica]|nr:ISNCY family transposase [Raoultella ornithinolytica]
PLGYKIFDKLTCVDLGAVVDNKRLGAVLRLAQQKQEELEAEGKRMRSTKMPRRCAQERALEELRAINPVLASPQDFIPSLKR